MSRRHAEREISDQPEAEIATPAARACAADSPYEGFAKSWLRRLSAGQVLRKPTRLMEGEGVPHPRKRP
jgi:hypothetical protein